MKRFEFKELVVLAALIAAMVSGIILIVDLVTHIDYYMGDWFKRLQRNINYIRGVEHPYGTPDIVYEKDIPKGDEDKYVDVLEPYKDIEFPNEKEVEAYEKAYYAQLDNIHDLERKYENKEFDDELY